jgi:hypothetical protein
MLYTMNLVNEMAFAVVSKLIPAVTLSISQFLTSQTIGVKLT